MSPDCLKLRPQTCFCQLLANILDWQVNVPTEHRSSSPGFTLFLWVTEEAVGSVFLQDGCFGFLQWPLELCLHLGWPLPPRLKPAGQWPSSLLVTTNREALGREQQTPWFSHSLVFWSMGWSMMSSRKEEPLKKARAEQGKGVVSPLKHM